MDITHLVVNGCSFTYGQGLDSPATQSWPALVAKQLDIPIVNLAVKGCGNDSIHRRTHEYLYENLSTGSKPLVIVAWSFYWRREAWFKTHYGQLNYNDYGVVSLPNELPTNKHELSMIENWSDDDFYRKSLLHKLSVINLFKMMNIPYLMSDHTNDNQLLPNSIKERFPNMYNEMLRDPNTVENFCNITDNLPKLSCGHDGIEAHKAIADYLLTEIHKRYDFTIVKDREFLTLQNYKIVQDKTDGTNWGPWHDI